MQVMSFELVVVLTLTHTTLHPVPNPSSFLLPSGQSGKLQIFELASGALLETVDAHEGALWSLCLAPDQVRLPPLPPSQHGCAPFIDDTGVLCSLSLLGVIAAEGDRDRKRRQDGQVLGL